MKSALHSQHPQSGVTGGQVTKRPSFFIVGAPRCATTAYYTYLRQHPAVFMPDLKEPHYFSPDLNTRLRVQALEDYLKLFQEAPDNTLVGEASVYYLYSEEAPRRILAFEPDAKIVIILRNPIDFIHSLHSKMVFEGFEPEPDFRRALELESRRRREREAGARLPFDDTFRLLYRDMGRFSRYVERYFHLFGRDRVAVILYDDIRCSAGDVFVRLCDFLGIERMARDRFDPINTNAAWNRFSRLTHDLLKAPPALAIALARVVLPREELRGRIRDALYRRFVIDSIKRPREPLDPQLRAALIDEFRPDVARLSELLGRDLTAWCEP